MADSGQNLRSWGGYAKSCTRLCITPQDPDPGGPDLRFRVPDGFGPVTENAGKIIFHEHVRRPLSDFFGCYKQN